MVKKHASQYDSDDASARKDQGLWQEDFKLKPIRNDYMRHNSQCDQGMLYSSITAILIVYDHGVFENTSSFQECVVRLRRARKHSTYNLFHDDATASFKDVARKQGVSVQAAIRCFNGALYDELYGSATPSPEQVRRAEIYLQCLGESLDEPNATGGH